MIVKFRVVNLSVLCFAWAATALSQSSLERQVLDTDSAWAHAENRHDIAALDRILDDQCVITSASGRTESKQEFLKQFTGEVKAVMTQDLVDRKVHIDGGTAILTETDNYTNTESGIPPPVASGSPPLTSTAAIAGLRLRGR